MQTNAIADQRVSEEAGRRIYIQEACFTSEALRSPELFYETAQVLASLTLPRTISHAISELELFGDEQITYTADSLICDLSFRSRQTEYLRQFAVRQNGYQPFMILSDRETIVANCFFSNYYTLATDEESAKAMFADNSSIAQVKGLSTEDLLLVSPKQLIHRPDKKLALLWANADTLDASVMQIAAATIDAVRENNTPENSTQIVQEILASANRLSSRLKNMITSFLKS